MRKRLMGVIWVAGLWFLPADTSAVDDRWRESPDVVAVGAELGIQEAVPSPEEIETAIQALDDPMDQERMSWLFNAIAQQPDEQVRQSLFTKLDARTSHLFETSIELPPVPPGGPEPVIPPELLEQAQQVGQVEMLRGEIESLRLGADATVEDLRKRDEVVAKIAQIADPDTRYELLELLNTHEREVQRDPANTTP